MTHDLFGVRIDDLSSDTLEQLFCTWLQSDKPHVIVTPNAEFLLAARAHPEFKDLLCASDLALADSVSLRYAIAALTDQTLHYRHPGVETLQKLSALMSAQGKRVLFLGGHPTTAAHAASVIAQRFPNLDIEGMDPGILTHTPDGILIPPELIQRINIFAPTLVAVGLGQIKQEQFMFQAKAHCPSVRIWIGVGGAFDMISGQKPRAPSWFLRYGFEWFWRLLIEPGRWRRILHATVVFPVVVAYNSLRAGTFLHSSRKVASELLKQFCQI